MDTKLLGIYVNDHLAGHVAGLELAKRSASSNKGTALGDFLEGFVSELEDERGVIEKALAAISRDPNRFKTMGAWVAEKAGRLKLNGNVVGYSPLSRVLEIEAMAHGVAAKKDLWDALKRMDVEVGSNLQELIAQADRQRAQLETHRHGALSAAFAGDPESV